MAALAGLASVLLTISLFDITYALDCYNCTDINDIEDCHTLVECPADVKECIAYSKRENGNMTFTLECASHEQCVEPTVPPMITLITTVVTPTKHNATTQGTTGVNDTIPTIVPSTTIPLNVSVNGSDPTLVGRRAITTAKIDNKECKQCCSGDACNKHLCPQDTDHDVNASVCADQKGFDCISADRYFQVCKDIDRAKLICKKHCDLCDLVDGQWSNWSNWTSCDVTCGNGTQTRNRTCDSPAPAHNGSECTGDDFVLKECKPRVCPLDGDWSYWSEWSNCSVSCGVGLQRRDRNCTDPPPDPDGQICFGDSRDDTICVEEACMDGVWSVWSDWGDCSSTCDVGLMRRERNCSTSSLFSTCVGDLHEDMLCHNGHCPGSEAAFLVSGRPSDGPENGTIKFSMVITNIGDDYNITTGRFVCRIPGIYSFFVSIEKQVDVGQAFCHLMKNNDSIIVIAVNVAIGDAHSFQQTSNSAVLKLEKGDAVYLGTCTNSTTMTKDSTFSGTLIEAD